MNVGLIWWEPLFSPPHLKAHYANSQHEYLPMRGPNRSQMHTNTYIIVHLLQFAHKQRSVGPASFSKLTVTLCLLDCGWLSSVQRLYQTRIIFFSMQKTRTHPHAALSRQPISTDAGVLLPSETQAEKIYTHTHARVLARAQGEEPGIHFCFPGPLAQPADVVILSFCDFYWIVFGSIWVKVTRFSLAWCRHDWTLTSFFFFWPSRWISWISCSFYFLIFFQRA